MLSNPYATCVEGSGITSVILEAGTPASKSPYIAAKVWIDLP